MATAVIKVALVCCVPTVLALMFFNADVSRYYRDLFRRLR